MAGNDRSVELQNFIIAKLAERVDAPAETIDASSVFIDIGLESVDAVLLCGEVEDEFQVELDPGTIFEHETVGSFVAEVTRRMSR